MGHVVLWGISSHGACCLVGHVIYGARVLGAFRLGAYCLGASCLGACRLTTGNDNHGDVVNDVRRQGGFERNIRKKINNGDYGRREKYDKRRGGLDAYNRRGYVRHGGGQKCFFT